MTDHLPDDEDEFTELRDADVPRVDLVSRAANGTPGFLVMKQDAPGLMDPDVIRDLLAKSEPEQPKETVTMTGSPAAIAKLIHEAAQRQTGDPVEKADGKKPAPKYRGLTQEAKDKYVADLKDSSKNPTHDISAGIRRMAQYAGSGNLPHGITYGDLKWMYNQAAAELHRRDPDSEAGGDLPALGSGVHKSEAGELAEVAKCQAMQTAFRSAGQEVGDDVEKAMGGEPDEGIDGMDPTVPMAAPEEGAPGDPNQPGSPAWEAIDAATARKWTSILVRARNAMGVLADREMMEAACADPDDAEAAWDLQTAQAAVDCAIGILAGFAVDEQAEADLATDAQSVAKALADFDSSALDTFEALTPVVKAGRTLSAANELAIRQAVESLTKVLASLPTPQPDEADQPVAKKEETMLVDPTTPDTTDAAPVAKADGDGAPTPVVPVYDATGKLVGVVDPGSVTPVECPKGADEPGDDMGEDVADEGMADEPPAAEHEAAADLEPAPPAEVGTPADEVPDGVTKTETAETTDDTTSDADSKSSIADMVKAELDAYSAPLQEVIAKQAQTIEGMAETIETLKGQVQRLEEQPAEPKVFTNGAVPPEAVLRGQDRGARPANLTRAHELKKGLYGAADAGEQKRIAEELQQMAIDQLGTIRQHPTAQ